MWAYRAATAHTLTSSHLKSICLEICVYKALYHLQKQGLLCLNHSCRSSAMTVRMRWQWAETSPLCYCGNRRDLWPLTSTPRLSTFDCLCGSAACPITNTHRGHDGLWWMVTCKPWGQLSQPHTESTSWTQIRRCVYVDVHLNNSFGSFRYLN